MRASFINVFPIATCAVVIAPAKPAAIRACAASTSARRASPRSLRAQLIVEHDHVHLGTFGQVETRLLELHRGDC